VILKLLSYNIRHGGVGRESRLAEVIRASDPDIAVFQEATRPAVIEQLATRTGMSFWGARAGHSLGFVSRLEIAYHEWHRPHNARRAFLEIIPAGTQVRIFGVHLTAVHSRWTEQRRARELRALLGGIRKFPQGFHVLTGDFNTLAPGEILDSSRLPARLRALVWLSGGRIRWHTIQILLDAHYVDGYRILRPDSPGFTFPTWSPHVRLDYVFLPESFSTRLKECEVFDGAAVKEASDHHPLLSRLEIS
jgi:exodeoxyribonuclease-3